MTLLSYHDFDTTPTPIDGVKYIDIPEFQPGQYLGSPGVLPALDDLLPEGGLIVLDAPKGGGKSWLLGSWTRDVGRVMVIGPDQAQVAAMAAAHDAETYKVAAPDADRVAVTTHSVRKFVAAQRGGVVVEEANQCRSAWLSDTCAGYGSSAKNATLRAMARAHWAVISSADFTPVETAWWIAAYRARCPGAAVTVVRVPPRPSTRTIEMVHADHLHSEFLAAVDSHEPGSAPLVYFVTSNSRPEEICQEVSARRAKLGLPALRCWWISGQNSDERSIVEDLRDPDRILDSHDLVVCSPSITSNLSWTRPVRKVFVSCSIGNFGSTSIGQQVGRCRNVLDPVALVSWTGVIHGLDPEAVETDYQSGAVDARFIVPPLFDGAEDHVTGEIRAYDREIFAAWIIEERTARIEDLDRPAALARLCGRSGWMFRRNDSRPEPATVKAARADRKAARASLKAARTARIVAASKGDGELGRTDSADLDALRAFYGVVELTAEQVAADLDSLRMLLAVDAWRRLDQGPAKALGRRDAVAAAAKALDLAGIDARSGGWSTAADNAAVGALVRSMGGEWRIRKVRGNRSYYADFSAAWALLAHSTQSDRLAA